MNKWIFSCALCLLMTTACGQVKTTEESQGPKVDAPASPQTPTPLPSNDEVTTNQGTSGGSEDGGKAFTPIAKNSDKDSAGLTAPQAPPVQKDIPDSDVQLNTDAKTKPPEKVIVTEVLGLGSDNQDVSHLLDRGYPAAILEAQVCRASGAFSNHARCLIVFKDGHSEWVGPANRELIAPFIEELQQASDSHKTHGKVKKHKSFYSFKDQKLVPLAVGKELKVSLVAERHESLTIDSLRELIPPARATFAPSTTKGASF